ncbi:MAG: arginine--tRNA ligase [bacterium]
MPFPYTLFRARQLLIEKFQKLGYSINPEEIRTELPGVEAGLAVPVFRLAKETGQNPKDLAIAICQRLDLTDSLLAPPQALNGYINLKFLPGPFATAVFADYRSTLESYGSFTIGKGKTIVIDYSSPNIAKPFSVGHLRSTVIGQALKNIFSYLGYRVIGDNHIGDWGTQFGKLLAAYELWGNETKLAQNPTLHLLDLYVRFHQTAKENPSLDVQAREWFRRLEQGDEQARARWQRFVDLSRQEFQKIYQLLGVTFDVTLGESFYISRLDDVIARALKNGIARREKPPQNKQLDDEEPAGEEPVVLIPLDTMGIAVPLILQKSDGTSLYATREIATAEYRIETWHPEKIFYVVGNEQKFYFQQFNAALKLLGITTPCIHIGFGLIRLPEGKLSTRAGRVILLDDLIQEAIERARRIVTTRDLPEEEKQQIARKVGIGAIKYADLSQNRCKDIVFDWDRMLALDGDSAPYLQYAYTRTRAILRKAKEFSVSEADGALLTSPEEQNLLFQIARFPAAVFAAAESYEPHRVANHLYALARSFAVFYDRNPVLAAETKELICARLALVEMTSKVLKQGLHLLGIEVMERM